MPITPTKHKKITKAAVPAPETQESFRDHQQTKPPVFINAEAAAIMSLKVLQDILEELKRQRSERSQRTQ